MKKFKAFTLIELIVAMAVFSILMAGIMNMVQPISQSAVEAKVINDQKNIENTISSYIGENLRLATNLYIVKGGNPSNAVSKFLAASPLDVYGNPITDPSKVKVICFDGTPQYTYANYAPTYGGRLITKVNNKTLTSTPFNKDSCTADGSGLYYMALGESYYQQAEYFLKVDMSSKMMKLTVSSNFYKSETIKDRDPNAFISSSANPVEGVYELKAFNSKPMDGAGNFIFKVVDSGGSEIGGITSVTPSDRDPIYFVYTTNDVLA